MQSLRETASNMLHAQYGALRSRLVELSKPLNDNFHSFNPKDNDPNAEHDQGLRLVSNFESLLVEFQSLLIWEKPHRTANALTIFTLLYWLLAMFEFRLIAVLASLVFCYHFYEMWTRFVWPEIRVENAEIKEEWTPMALNVLSAPEIERYLDELRTASREFVSRVAQFRNTSHGAFSVSVTLILTAIFMISRTIPGVLIVYIFVTLVFLAPGIVFYVVPPEVHEQIVRFFAHQQSGDSIDGASSVRAVRNPGDTCPSTPPPSAATTTAGSSKSSSSSQLSTLVENFFAGSSSSSSERAARGTVNSTSASRKTSANSSVDLDEFELIDECEFVN